LEKSDRLFLFQSSLKLTDAKIEFLDGVAEYFPAYLEETFEAIWLRNNRLTEKCDPKVRFVACTINVLQS
jgi:hypothetical protein